jgi:hypothetical protein
MCVTWAQGVTTYIFFDVLKLVLKENRGGPEGPSSILVSFD